MTRRRFFSLVLISALALGGLFLFPLPPEKEGGPRSPSPGATGAPISTSPTAAPPAGAPPRTTGEMLRQEALRAGQISADPAEDERRLDREADALSANELDALSMLARDSAAQGDPRATAAELLARARKLEAIAPLESLALDPVPAGLDPRTMGFERALRARAVEGLAQIPGEQADKSLKKLRDRVEDPFVRDRLERAAAARAGAVPAPETQDEKALRKLLDSP